MPKFGKTSLRRLDTAHCVLQLLASRVVVRRDIAITEGFRDEAKQELYHKTGTSKVRWPNSKHNSQPSMAIDFVPYPELWSSKDAFMTLSAIVYDEWSKMEKRNLTSGYALRWGGDWDGDGDTTDQTFNDLPHWELIN